MSIASQFVHDDMLDGKAAWDACLQYGGIRKASRQFINPRTDKFYNPTGFSRIAYQWALVHLDIVRPQWEAVARGEGIVPTDKAWRDWLVQKAHVAYYYAPGKYERFLKEHNLP